MSRYWVSWYILTEDYKPIHVDENIPECWCTGSNHDSETMCAIVDADDGDAAHETICTYWNSHAIRWRFIHEVSHDWCPDPDRFYAYSRDNEGTATN